jgi:hypothetical protein
LKFEANLEVGFVATLPLKKRKEERKKERKKERWIDASAR